MKNKILLLVELALYGILAILLIGVLLGFLGGSKFNFNFWEEQEMNITTNFKANTADVKDFDISLVSEDLYIEQSTTDDVRIEVYSNDPDYAPYVEQAGSTVRIRVPKRIIGFNFQSGYVKIYVPKNAEFKYDIDLVSGKTHAYINGDLDVNVVSGGIYVDGTPKKTKLRAVSGRIELAYDAAPTQNISLETVSGRIELAIPENEGFTLGYSSISGRTKTDFADNNMDFRKKGTYTYKNGVVKIDASTVSGGISVNKK